jgi:multidrug resistance efflux pump
MSVDQASAASPQSTAGLALGPGPSDQALWQEFVEAGSAEGFCQAWLGLLCRHIDDATGALVLLGAADGGPFSPVAFWPGPHRGLEVLAGPAEQALRQRRGVVVADGGGAPEGRVQVAYPVEVAGRLHGVVAVEALARPGEAVQALLRTLHWGVAWIEVLVRRQAAAEESGTRERLYTVLELLAGALEQPRFQGACSSLVTETANRLACDRVSLGFVRRGRARVQAISHSASFGQEMNLVRLLEGAMDEALDQDAPVLFPAAAGEGPQAVSRAHEELARQHGAGHVCTVPVRLEGAPAVALTLERPPGRAFGPMEVELCQTLGELVAPVLALKRSDERWLVARAGAAVRDQAVRLLGPRYLPRKLVALGVVALAAFLTFARGEFRVAADTTVEGAVLRAVVAPFDGYVAEAPVRAGDRVQAGDLLAALDDRDLKLERVRLATQRAQHQREQKEAAAKHERAQERILSAQLRQAEAQLALVDEELARTRLTAPFAGLVVSGDLSQSLGAPVQRGDVLFEVAPLDRYRIVLRVDERDIGEVREGQRGHLVLGAFPDAALPFLVRRVTPVSSAGEGRNYFRVEAELEGASERLRPGLEGVAKIGIGERNLAWVWSRPIVAWVRLQLWSWWP